MGPVHLNPEARGGEGEEEAGGGEAERRGHYKLHGHELTTLKSNNTAKTYGRKGNLHKQKANPMQERGEGGTMMVVVTQKRPNKWGCTGGGGLTMVMGCTGAKQGGSCP